MSFPFCFFLHCSPCFVGHLSYNDNTNVIRYDELWIPFLFLCLHACLLCCNWPALLSTVIYQAVIIILFRAGRAERAARIRGAEHPEQGPLEGTVCPKEKEVFWPYRKGVPSLFGQRTGPSRERVGAGGDLLLLLGRRFGIAPKVVPDIGHWYITMTR